MGPNSKAKESRVWCLWVMPTAKHSCTEKEPSLRVQNITLSVTSRLLACGMVSPTFRVVVALLLLTDESTVHTLDLKSTKTVLLLHCIFSQVHNQDQPSSVPPPKREMKGTSRSYVMPGLRPSLKQL